MAIRRKRESRDQRRFTRRSMKRGIVLRPPAHPWRIVGGVLGAVGIVALALVWGSYLKERSDALRDAKEKGEWTLETPSESPIPPSAPHHRAMAISPMGNVGDIIIAGNHSGVIMTLNRKDGTLRYRSAIGERAGLPTEPDAPTLTEDVNRVAKRDLLITCAFTLTCFSAEDTPTHTYLRGLELALLREYAQSGMNHLLLFGLPAGSDAEDAEAIRFLKDLRETLSDLPNPPAIGVALPAACFTTEEQDIPLPPETELDTSPEEESESESAALPNGTPPHYVGDLTPARLLTACDYLAIDLRALTPQEMEIALPHLPYAYTRYSLTLLVNPNPPAIGKDAVSHGFERLFELEP